MFLSLARLAENALAAGDGIDDKGRSEDEMLVDGITGMDHEQVFQAN
jgi:hypothetical protein